MYMINLNENKIQIFNKDCNDLIKEIEDESVDLIIIDPPYLCTKEKWDQKDVVTKELSKELYRVLKNTGNFYCWGGDRQ